MVDIAKKQYIRAYAEYSLVLPEAVRKPLPLNETELEQVTIEWYKIQLERLRKDKTFKPDMLDAELHEIVSETQMYDFRDTTLSIKDNAQQELEGDRDNSEGGWLLLDDW